MLLREGAVAVDDAALAGALVVVHPRKRSRSDSILRYYVLRKSHSEL